MIYWRDTFSIIKRAFPVNDKAIAAKLNITPSLLSNIKSGRRKCNIQIDEIYNKIFDLNNEESLASYVNPKEEKAFQLAINAQVSQQREQLLLNLFLTIINEEFPKVKDQLKGLENEKDYKTFVIGLLGMTRDASTIKSSDGSDKIASTPEAPADGLSKEEEDITSSSRVSDEWDNLLEPSEIVHMPYAFYRSYEDYAMEGFIKLNPVDLIEINYMLAAERPDGLALIKRAMRFVRHMEVAIENTEIVIWNKSVCTAIFDYIKTLREYIDFLRKNSIDPNLNMIPFLLDPVAVKGVEYKVIEDAKFGIEVFEYDQEADEVIAEFEREATEYRTKLQSLYEEIDQYKKG